MQVGQHVKAKDHPEHTGHITQVLLNHVVEVQWDHAPWGSRVLWHEYDLRADPERDAKVRAEWERHRDEYYERSARGQYQGD